MTAPADSPPDPHPVDPRLHALRTLAGFLVRHGRAGPTPPEPPADRDRDPQPNPEPGSEAARRAA